MVKNSKEETRQEFRLKDEIEYVVDLFIQKPHRQTILQNAAEGATKAFCLVSIGGSESCFYRHAVALVPNF
ncbi:hypothetical protein L6164_031699 [Bauhinia variegata]|uniref:Uncharacterized protein n=1 Tax=Bauhinia variegata TaxID=167791 RepID=A0ACB9LG96_BAUVA|nr:hypothetical protein L6164_031699 [Bauhinia variegata]